MRKWYKLIPPKKCNEIVPIYQGVWMPLMDRYWESEDGYSVMSHLIRTEIGVVEHVTIQNMVTHEEVPWAVKQEIKNELFGDRRVAIEVFPDQKNLVDVCNVYHLWVLPKGIKIPFGIHPTRDPQGIPVGRGYDFDLDVANEWINSPERKAIVGDLESSVEALIEEVKSNGYTD